MDTSYSYHGSPLHLHFLKLGASSDLDNMIILMTIESTQVTNQENKIICFISSSLLNKFTQYILLV